MRSGVVDLARGASASGGSRCDELADVAGREPRRALRRQGDGWFGALGVVRRRARGGKRRPGGRTASPHHRRRHRACAAALRAGGALGRGDAEVVGETLGPRARGFGRSAAARGTRPVAVALARYRRDPGRRTAGGGSHCRRGGLTAASDVTHGILHGDPAPEAFVADGSRVGVIDWGSALHGPLVYDLASARMYAGPGVVTGYLRTAPLEPAERSTWTSSACFAGRSRPGTSRGGSQRTTSRDRRPAENEKGWPTPEPRSSPSAPAHQVRPMQALCSRAVTTRDAERDPAPSHNRHEIVTHTCVFQRYAQSGGGRDSARGDHS